MIVITAWWQYAHQTQMSTVALNEQQNRTENHLYISFYIQKNTKYIYINTHKQQYNTRFDQQFALKGWNSKRGNVITWGTFLNIFKADALPVLACMQACNRTCIWWHCVVCITYWHNQNTAQEFEIIILCFFLFVAK